MTQPDPASIAGPASALAGQDHGSPSRDSPQDADPGPPPTPADIARQRIRFLFRHAGDGAATSRLRRAVLDWRLEHLA